MNKEQIAKLKELPGKLHASGIASRADAELVQAAYDALAERTTSPVSQMTDERLDKIADDFIPGRTVTAASLRRFARAVEFEVLAAAAPAAPYPTRECAAEALTPSVGAPAAPVAQDSKGE